MKVQRKAKTVFWLSIIKNSFRITFYFTDRAEDAIFNSNISDELKESFKSGKRYNKIRGITVIFKRKKDVDYGKELIGIKLSVKQYLIFYQEMDYRNYWKNKKLFNI